LPSPKAWDHANLRSDYSRDLRRAKWGSEVKLHGSNHGQSTSALADMAGGKIHVRFASDTILTVRGIRRASNPDLLEVYQNCESGSFGWLRGNMGVPNV
jgi:hypothetical protein